MKKLPLELPHATINLHFYLHLAHFREIFHGLKFRLSMLTQANQLHMLTFKDKKNGPSQQPCQLGGVLQGTVYPGRRNLRYDTTEVLAERTRMDRFGVPY